MKECQTSFVSHKEKQNSRFYPDTPQVQCLTVTLNCAMDITQTKIKFQSDNYSVAKKNQALHARHETSVNFRFALRFGRHVKDHTPKDGEIKNQYSEVCKD